jgi:hypothetical protein
VIKAKSGKKKQGVADNAADAKDCAAQFLPKKSKQLKNNHIFLGKNQKVNYIYHKNGSLRRFA